METMNPSARLVSTRVYYGCTYRRRRKSTDDESGFAVLRRGVASSTDAAQSVESVVKEFQILSFRV